MGRVELESCPESSSGEAMITDYSVNPTIGTYYTIFEFKISYSVIKDAGSGDMQLTITPPTDKNPIGKQNKKKKKKKKEKVFYIIIYNIYVCFIFIVDTTLLINTVPGNYTVSFEWQPLPTTSPNTGEYEWQVALCQGTCYGDAPNCE